VKESSTDLGIALALLSSYFQKPVPAKSISIAEISLTGQIKPTYQASACINEIEKFGINTAMLAASQKIKSRCKTVKFKNVLELLNLFPE